MKKILLLLFALILISACGNYNTEAHWKSPSIQQNNQPVQPVQVNQVEYSQPGEEIAPELAVQVPSFDANPGVYILDCTMYKNNKYGVYRPQSDGAWVSDKGYVIDNNPIDLRDYDGNTHTFANVLGKIALMGITLCELKVDMDLLAAN